MNTPPLICKSLDIHTTTVCTLKCAKCGWNFPSFRTPVVADINKITTSLEILFQVYDYVSILRFSGAEGFLYSDIQTLMKAVSNFKAQFEYAIIPTNGTYIPSKPIIDTMKSLPYPLIVRVDNYGELSKKYIELVSTLRSNDITVDERTYTGTHQAFGGWVDLGDYTDRHYSADELKRVFYSCRQPGSPSLLEDKLIFCCRATAGYMLNKTPLHEREYIDFSSERDISKIRTKIKNMMDEPFEACRYCNGFDPVNSPRIPAAEQLP